MRMLMKVL